MKKILLTIVTLFLTISSTGFVYAENEEPIEQEITRNEEIETSKLDECQELLLSLPTIEEINDENKDEIVSIINNIEELLLSLTDEEKEQLDLNNYYAIYELINLSDEENIIEEEPIEEDEQEKVIEEEQEIDEHEIDSNEELTINSNNSKDENINSDFKIPPLTYIEDDIDSNKLLHKNNIVINKINPLPESFSLIDEGYVTPVKDQNPYGSCWSFAAMGSIESTYLKKYGETLDLSELQLAWFAMNSYNVEDSLRLITKDGAEFDYEAYYGSDIVSNYNYEDYFDGCLDNGGNQQLATYNLAQGIGISDENHLEYPSTGEWTQWTDGKYIYEGPQEDYLTDIPNNNKCYYSDYRLVSSDWYSMQETEIVKEALMDKGALAISMYYDDAYITNDGSITPNGKHWGGKSYYNNKYKSSNHAVLLVGWDDNYSKDNFKIKPKGDGAWLIKNSWSKYWGDNGYFWISYYDQSVKNSEAFAYVVEKVDDSDEYYLYQYDGGYCIDSIIEDNKATFANIYRSQRKESITDVGLFTFDANVNYEIKVYANLQSTSNPESGELKYTQKGIIENAGYHLIELEDYSNSNVLPIIVENNNYYSIVVTYSKINSTIDVPIDYTLTYGCANIYNEVEDDLSFIKQYDSNSGSMIWKDLKEGLEDLGLPASTAKIKVYTTPATSIIDGKHKYTTEYYLQDLDGQGFTKTDLYTRIRYAETGTLVNAIPISIIGFTYDSDNQNEVISGNVLENDSLTLKLYYKRNKYNIIFMSDEEILATYENVMYETPLLSLNNIPVIDPKEGYDYVGWDIDLNSATSPAEDLIVNAVWKQKECIVTIDLNGGFFENEEIYEIIDDDGIKKKIILYGDELYLPTPFKEGLLFDSWYLKENGEATNTKLESIGVIKDDCEIIAKYFVNYSFNVYSLIDEYYGYSNNINENEIEYNLNKKNALLRLFCDEDGTSIKYSTDADEPRNWENYEKGIIVSDGVYYCKAVKGELSSPELKITINYEVDVNEGWGEIDENDRPASVDGVVDQIWIGSISENEYTGKKIEPEFNVYDYKAKLEKGTDYTVSYKNNIKAGTATATVTLKGNYSGNITKTFNITRASLLEGAGNYLSFRDVFVSYTGKEIKKEPVIYYKGIKLKKGTDYTISYNAQDNNGKAYLDCGSWAIEINGTGNYEGSFTLNEIISDKKDLSKATATKIPDQEWNNGTYITLDETLINLTFNRESIGSDQYEISYENNTNPGVASVIIKAKDDGNFFGEKIVNFNIKGIPINKTSITLGNVPYNPTEFEDLPNDGNTNYFKPLIEIRDNTNGENVLLHEDDGPNDNDYQVHCTNNKKVGTATVEIIGLGKYTGSVKKTYKILPYDISERIANDYHIYLDYNNYVSYKKGSTTNDIRLYYDDQENRLVNLVENQDYTVSYKNNTKPGIATMTIKGKGNYTGTITKEFTIVKANLPYDNVVVADKVYTGKTNSYATTVTITDDNGKKLVAGTDYDKEFEYYYAKDTRLENGELRFAGCNVEKEDIIPVGTRINILVTGKGNYYGSNSFSYRIIAGDLSKATVTVPTQYYQEDGRPLEISKQQLTVKLGKVYLCEDDYEIVDKYVNVNNKGKGSFTLVGKGNYGGTKTVTFNIQTRPAGCVYVFNGNGANSGSMSNVVLKAGQIKTINIKDIKFVRKGYKFMGFATDEDGINILYGPADSFVLSYKENELITLYAIWQKEDAYQINYVYDKADENSNPTSYTVNDEIVLENLTPNDEVDNYKYEFGGWYKDVNFKSKVTKIERGTTGDITLYAKWNLIVGLIEDQDGNKYYQQKDGTLATNKVVKIGDYQYKFDDNGKMIINDSLEDMTTDYNGKDIYVNYDGTLALNHWKFVPRETYDGELIYIKKCHYDSKGNLETGLKTYSEKDENGKAVKNTYYLAQDGVGYYDYIYYDDYYYNKGDIVYGAVDIKEKQYYFDDIYAYGNESNINYGRMIKNDIVDLYIDEENIKTMVFNSSGVRVKNAITKIGNTSYYVDEDGFVYDDLSCTSDFSNKIYKVTIKGKDYYFADWDNHLLMNEEYYCYEDGKYYYFKNGQPQKGFVKLTDGTKYYDNDNYYVITKDFIFDKNKWYYASDYSGYIIKDKTFYETGHWDEINNEYLSTGYYSFDKNGVINSNYIVLSDSYVYYSYEVLSPTVIGDNIRITLHPINRGYDINNININNIVINDTPINEGIDIVDNGWNTYFEIPYSENVKDINKISLDITIEYDDNNSETIDDTVSAGVNLYYSH